MTSRLISSLVLVATSCCLVISCRKDSDASGRTLGFDAFVPRYNVYIQNWLIEQQGRSKKEAIRIAADLTTAQGVEKDLLEIQAQANRRALEKWQFRLGLGDFLKLGQPSEIPADLVWENGLDQPEMGDPRAQKGGVLRRHILDFPPTIRPFGPNSNNSFRSDLYDLIDMRLITFHMETMKLIPGLAKEWAVSKDKRTIYFRIDPDAHYSDGVPVQVRDYLITVYLNVSDNVVNAYQKQFYRENIAQVAMYGDHTLSISLPDASFFGPLTAGSLTPSPAHFYSEYGPDYAERYQWRFPPTTGPYEVKSGDIVKGVSITQTRVNDWWAKDRKFYRYRFNPDKLVSTVVRDESKAFELFRAGELDTFLITRPELWYEKSEMPPVYDGYIERTTFYKQYPRVPLGLYMNVSKPPLDNRDVRIGINHAINWQKVIDVIFRGDYQRLNSFNEGYGKLGDLTIRARPYSIKSARDSFAKAGYAVEGADGILKKSDGTRLSVAFSYPSLPIYDRMFSLLREDAKPCGLELRLDGLEPTVAYKMEMQKQHEMTFSSWNTSPPGPDFYEFLHSTNARDEKGNPKPDTNNIFVWARPDTDRLCDIVRSAASEEELSNAAGKLQRIMHDEAIFVPGYAIDFVKVGYWRWVKWPDCENTRFSPPVTYEPHETHVLWIDSSVKAETQAARREGKVFRESTRVVDEYRIVAPSTVPVEP